MRFAFFALLLTVGATAHSQTTVDYQPSDTDFPNPERGIYRYTETRSENYTPLDADVLAGYRNPGSVDDANYTFVSTLIFRYFFLGDFTGGPISQEYLDNVVADLDEVRRAGVKIIPRFAYTDNVDGSGCASFICPPYGDAPKAVVLNHIRQLKPILTANADVIAALQMGFIGTWGENYYTDFFGDASQQGKLFDENWADRNEVLAALLDALPENRAVQVRYPQIKQKFIYGIDAPTGSAPLTPAEAFSGADKARIGYHNDCLLAGPDDFGTYADYGTTTQPAFSDTTRLKPYFAQDSRYLPVGGETCGDAYNPQNNCPSQGGLATLELKRMHYSYLNSGFNNDVNNDWVDGGCMEDIKRQLGYRLELQRGTLPVSATTGGQLTVELVVTNRGYAAPFNERDVQLILRNTDNGIVYVGGFDADPRTWGYEQPTHSLSGSFCVPAAMPIGTYELLLNLPDPEVTLRENPDYSIRLANTLGGSEIWEPTTGYNLLGGEVVISDGEAEGCSAGPTLRALATVLPVRFSDLKADPRGKDVLITWRTEAEADNAGFEVERSVDGEQFTTVGRVAPNAAFAYTLVDAEVDPGTRYFYRVRQLDHSGASRLSGTVTTMIGEAVSLRAFPNPARGVINLNNARGALRVLDRLGRPVPHVRNGNQVILQPHRTGVFTLLLEVDGRALRCRVVVQ